ncbi:MAG: GxGYxYP domain-containing protein [Candidatus Omnitrophota bacterium]
MTILPCLAVLLMMGQMEPIAIFDLTYTLNYDLNDPKQAAAAWDHCHAAATLQGIVNRDDPRLYIRYVSNGGINIDDYWLNRMSEPGQWLAGAERKKIPDIAALITTFRDFIKGAVVYDPKVPATSNLASTIAGAEDLIAVRYDPSSQSLYTKIIVKGPKLPVVKRLLKADGSSLFTGRGVIPDTDIPSTGSAKCDAYLWLKNKYIDAGLCDAVHAGFYIDSYWLKNPTAANPNHHTLTNHDFFVAKRGFFFDLGVWDDEAPIDDPKQVLGTDLNTLKALLLSAYERGGKDVMTHIGGFIPWAFKYTSDGAGGGQHEGVPTEWEFSRIASAYNTYVDADAFGMGAMANASFFSHYPLQEKYPQAWTTKEDLTARGYLAPDGKINFDGRQFIVFYVGDYDSAAWVYQQMPLYWDDPNRGKLPMMWCVSPIIEKRAGMAMDYMRRTSAANDYFAAPDNGAGYLNPGMLQEPRPISGLPSGLEAWGKHCASYYDRWDLSVTGFVIDGYAPGLNQKGLDCYAQFSPNGIVPQKIPLTLLHGEMPVLRADYDVNGNPDEAVGVIMERVKARKVPFHWFRNILKPPSWYVEVRDKLKEADSKLELLDAPSFFELYRIYLKTHPSAAKGKIQ